MKLKSSEKCERGMMGMRTEGGQLLLPPLSFIINSNIPPKVIVSDKGWGREISEMKKSRKEEMKEEPKIRIFGGGGLLASFHHFGISQSLVLLKLTFSRHWHLSPSDVPLRTTPPACVYKPLASLVFRSLSSSNFSKISISCLDSFVLFSRA